MNTIKIKGELEIDVRRGVIYFHSQEKGITVLRISQLSEETLNDSELIDISIGFTKSKNEKS